MLDPKVYMSILKQSIVKFKHQSMRLFLVHIGHKTLATQFDHLVVGFAYPTSQKSF